MAKPWPASLAGAPATVVIDQAIGRGRLGHSLLLHGDDLELLGEAAAAIADRLLNPRGDFAGSSHPDRFDLRPVGKQRQINAESTRELIGKVQVSAAVAERKVAIVHEADRMNTAAANIFLKTLEEPPAATTLLLLTTHPYALLPTIRSRCLHFRFPTREGDEHPPAEGWAEWLADYQGWLAGLGSGDAGSGGAGGADTGGGGKSSREAGVPPSAAPPDKRAVADHIFTIYGLVARFGHVLDTATAKSWEAMKPGLPAELDENEQVAIETGLANGLRSRLFADIEFATNDHARRMLAAGQVSARRFFPAAIGELEHLARLLRLNLNESAALEAFLLQSLRIWSNAG